MRWYCVHPGLPLQAELRVRTAPDSGAAERARVSQGRAIAACSPVFQVAGDAADDAPISWLQVAYQDAASGETEGGFMMASLPDGTPLLAPWETTDFCGCCEVTDPAALLFDESEETAQSLGPVQSVNLLYCMMEVRGGRVRIFHPTLQSAWIDAKDVHVVCSRLKHDFCSTAHTFYELNETLPEEAQIAIREFPSKEAQTVGLLSRGETLEVTVRGGNWLKIAGGSVDKAWIMWRTDALELLQEAPDVSSGNCERLDVKVDNSGGLQDQGATINNQTEPPCPHEVTEESTTGVMPTPNAEIDAAPEVDAAALAAASVAMDDEASAVAGDLPATNDAIDTAENAEINDPCQDNDGALPNGTKSKENASRDGPARIAATVRGYVGDDDSETTGVVPEVDDTTVADKDTNTDVVAAGDVEQTTPTQGVKTWDDRRIQPEPTPFSESGNASATEQDGDDDATVETAPEMDAAAMDDENDAETAAVAGEEKETVPVQTASSWDDRPIRPAPVVSDDVYGDDDATVETAPEMDAAAMDDENDAETAAVAGEEKEAVPVQTASSWDDRPIRPAPVVSEVSDDVVGSADAMAKVDNNTVVEIYDSGAPATEKGEESGPIKADGSLDDRPIQSASTVLNATENSEVAQVGPSWGDRPIRPAPSLPAVAGHDDATTAEVKTEHVDCGAQDGKAMEPVRMDNLAAFDGNLVEPRAGRIQQNNHYLHPTNPTNAFERRYTESETTSGSESGEIALLGGLEDVFDPVDELLPAMAEDIIREIDEGITGVLSAAASEPVSIGAANVGGNLHDANQAAQDKTPFDNGSPSDGISYLQHFGIGKYCKHKQSLAAGSDELSQAMYEANQDDSDLVFQALVGDEPLSDDWFHEVSLRDLQAGPHLRAGPKTTYDLIMANASPEEILEAELLDDEDGDFDLIMSFKYPVPKRRAIEPSRSPSLFRRVPSAPTGMSAIETKTAISPAKPSSESDLDSDDSPPGSRQPSPVSHRASISARTSPIPARSTTPLKSVLPRQPVGPPSSPVPPAGSRLMQRKSIATPSSTRKPPSSLLRPRSFVQSSQPAAPASPALSKPAASGLTAPSRSSIPATSTSSIATPTRSLLQRRSMLSAPSPAKTIAAPSATRSSITGSTPKPTEVSSGLQAPRKSFGFRRPSGLTKKT